MIVVLDKMKIYIASSTENRSGALLLKQALQKDGYSVSSSWIEQDFAVEDTEVLEKVKANIKSSKCKCSSCTCTKKTNPMPNLSKRALTDFQEIRSADVLVMMYPYGYGTSCEVGYAVGLGKPILFLTDPTHVDDLPLGAGVVLEHNNNAIAFNYEQLKTLLKEWNDNVRASQSQRAS